MDTCGAFGSFNEFEDDTCNIYGSGNMVAGVYCPDVGYDECEDVNCELLDGDGYTGCGPILGGFCNEIAVGGGFAACSIFGGAGDGVCGAGDGLCDDDDDYIPPNGYGGGGNGLYSCGCGVLGGCGFNGCGAPIVSGQAINGRGSCVPTDGDVIHNAPRRRKRSHKKKKSKKEGACKGYRTSEGARKGLPTARSVPTDRQDDEDPCDNCDENTENVDNEQSDGNTLRKGRPYQPLGEVSKNIMQEFGLAVATQLGPANTGPRSGPRVCTQLGSANTAPRVGRPSASLPKREVFASNICKRSQSSCSSESSESSCSSESSSSSSCDLRIKQIPASSSKMTSSCSLVKSQRSNKRPPHVKQAPKQHLNIKAKPKPKPEPESSSESEPESEPEPRESTKKSQRKQSFHLTQSNEKTTSFPHTSQKRKIPNVLATLVDDQLVSLIDFKEVYIVDICGYENAIFVLLSNGDILKLVEKKSGDEKFAITGRKNNVKLTAICNFGGYLYGVHEESLYRLDNRTYNTGSWKWNPLPWAPTLIVEINTTLSGEYLWIMTSRGDGYLFTITNSSHADPKRIEKTKLKTVRRVYGIDEDSYLEINRDDMTAVKYPEKETLDGIVDGVLTNNGDVVRISPTLAEKVAKVKIVNWEPLYIVYGQDV